MSLRRSGSYDSSGRGVYMQPSLTTAGYSSSGAITQNTYGSYPPSGSYADPSRSNIYRTNAEWKPQVALSQYLPRPVGLARYIAERRGFVSNSYTGTGGYKYSSTDYGGYNGYSGGQSTFRVQETRRSPLEHLTMITEITPYLFLSGQQPITPTKLKSLGITHVINTAAESPNLCNTPGVNTTYIHVYDSPTERLNHYFDSVADKIDLARQNRGRVLVHCIAGVSRSCSLILAYFMKHLRMTLRDAFHYVQARRPIVNPNNGFWMQLIAFERHVHSRTTVTMEQSGGAWSPSVYREPVRRVTLTNGY